MARLHFSFLAFLQYGNLPIPLVAAGVLGVMPLRFGLPASYPLMAAGAAGAFVLYQLDRAWQPSPEDVHNQPGRLVWVRSHRLWRFFSTLLAPGGIVVAHLQQATVTAGKVLGLAGAVYLLPILPGRERPKGHWLVKLLAIGGAWSIGVLVLPALEAGLPLDARLAARRRTG